MDRKTWTEVIEYIAAAAVAILIAIVLAEHFTTPLWGGLSGAPFLQ